jgi:hypothetical protein
LFYCKIKLIFSADVDKEHLNICFSGIHKMTLSDAKLGMTKEVMATKVLPFLFPLSIENGLTVTQVESLL